MREKDKIVQEKKLLEGYYEEQIGLLKNTFTTER